MTDWLPITHAQKDGEHYLVCVAGPEYRADKAFWNHGAGKWQCGPFGFSKQLFALLVEPTHYKELPEPPAIEKDIAP